MNDNNSVLEKLTILAEEKGFLTLSDIEKVIPLEQINNHLSIKLQKLLSKDTFGNDKIENDKKNLISNHVCLIENIAKEIIERKPSTLAFDELLQEGYLGLLKAATNFNPDAGDKFLNYASKKITEFIEKAIENEQRLGIFNSDISRAFFSKEHRDYISSWKEEDEDIFTTTISNQSKSIDKDSSELTMTRIGKIQLPFLPDFNKVTPSLTSNDESILVEKKNISDIKKVWIDRPEHVKQFIIDKIYEDGENLSAITNESVPKVYSKVSFDNDRRLSLYAKVVGERGEKIVLKYLADTLTPNERASIRWVSALGETPGWDIEYYDSNNNVIAIEVKGTNGKSFPNIEITGNEWNAALKLQDQYWIYLVSDCLGTKPKIQRLQNPFKLKEAGVIRTIPILWRIELISAGVLS